MEEQEKKRTKTQIFSRVCGYLRPTSQFNEGKEAEFKDRKVFNINNIKLKDKKK